jgi:hypothetical protein
METEVMNTNTSRRAVLAGAATLPALAVPAAAGSLTHDPIFAAIERARRAYGRCCKVSEWEDQQEGAGIKLVLAEGDHRTPELRDAVNEAIDARYSLAETAPTTLAGLLAWLQYVAEQSAVEETFYFDNAEECMAFATTLGRAVRGIAGLIEARS